MVAAGIGYHGLLKQSFKSYNRKTKQAKLQQQAPTLPRKADKGGVTGSFYFTLQLEDAAMGSWIEEL